jgi:hypothetical protein
MSGLSVPSEDQLFDLLGFNAQLFCLRSERPGLRR